MLSAFFPRRSIGCWVLGVLHLPFCRFGRVPLLPSPGKLAVLGSCHVFHDQYLEQEENAKVLDVIIQWLSSDDFTLDTIDAEDPDVADYHFLPHTEKLASQLRSALQEGEEVSNPLQRQHGLPHRCWSTR